MDKHQKSLNTTQPSTNGMSKLISYLSGIIDGEGSIMIRKAYNRKGCVNPTYSPRISLKMNNEIIPRLLKQIFGGNYYKCKQIYQSRSGFKYNSIMHCYNVEHKKAFSLVHKIMPYIIVKKEQAKLVLQLQNLKKHTDREGRNGKSGGIPYSKEYINKLEYLWLQNKYLN